MPFFQRAANGWRLAVESWQVLKLDKELLLFPVASGIACLLVMASFAVPLWATGYIEMLADSNGEISQANKIIGYAVAFAYYFVNYFVIIFFNSALIACAIIRFKGGNPTLADGISAASARIPQIAGWALVAATVGIILRVIESQSEKFGSIVAGLLGMAWSAVTYFVVPVIVVERTGPITAAKRSFEVIKKTWGEALSAHFGIGFIIFLASLVGVLPLIGGVFAIGAGHIVPGIICVAVGLAALLVVSLVSSALNAIIIGALYLYAAEGTVPRQFDEDLFQHAFGARR